MTLPSPKREEYVQLIEFVRPENDLTGSRERPPNLRHNSDLTNQTALSGDEARSFYEELFTSPGSTHLNKMKKTSGKLQQKQGTQHIYEYSALKMFSHGTLGSFKRKSNIIKEMKFPSTGSSSDMAEASRNKSSPGTYAVQALKSAKSKNQTKASHHTHNLQRALTHKEAELLKCAQNGELDVVQKLIASGIDVNASDMFGWTAAMCAAFEGHTEVLKILIGAGADLLLTNSGGQTALMLSQSKRHTSAVHFIEKTLEKNIDDGFEVHETTPVSLNKHFYYCDMCKIVYSDKKAHFTSTVHLFNKGLKPRDNTFLIPPSNVGYRMLVRSGWDDNKGLGPDGQGLKYPVKTYLKRDRKGLGASKNESAKITHFQPNDRSAVDKVRVQKNNLRKPNIKTLARKAQRRKERLDKLWEIDMRRALS